MGNALRSTSRGPLGKESRCPMLAQTGDKKLMTGLLDWASVYKYIDTAKIMFYNSTSETTMWLLEIV